ncbi:MAG: Sugar kinase, ribokinase family [Parcubacteria group bacterium GW2011_GWA2_50_10b]|nr:MAG: Sugar kinase, ribokinase family [Parcubacteria group bacterium GW2011_GWA2_50_10b]
MPEFIAIGDIVTDAFIKLKEASTHCDINREHCTLSMAFGDKVPYESVEEIPAVGNSANAAVSAVRLGLSSALVTHLGDDENGVKALARLQEEKVGTEFVSKESGKKTNYHYVLWYGDDRTILVKHEAYEYKLPEFGNPKWLYLSSLGESTMIYHSEISEYLKKNPNIQLAFQPGTFQLNLGTEKLKDIYKRTKIFFCNVREAEKILNIDTLGTAELLKRLRELGPEIVVVTDGPKGAHVYDGKKSWHQSAYPDPKPPLERTGAGDAMASTTVAALALGKDLETAVRWGMINSMSVVQEIGAQKGLLSREKIEAYLKSAPAEFQKTM